VSRRWRVWVLSVVLALVPTALVRADVSVHGRTENSLFVDILGTITNQDPKTFESAIEDLGSRRLYARLDSVGGDVFAAMHIGRLIRKHDGLTIISVPSKCYSSCALLFISGVMRHNLGELGLHRPYQLLVLQGRQTMETQLPRMLALLREYVAEMGIAESFYDQMVNTEHTKTVIYRIDSSANLVPEIDPGFLEAQFTYGARRYGMTAAQMRQRERDAEVCLTRAVKEIAACQEAIKWGVSEQLYRERNAKIGACELGPDDRRIVQAVPPGQRRDHPFVRRHEACQQKIMLGR
jgi:hypothetical protein